MLRNSLIASLLVGAVTAPAIAHDKNVYVGIEGGVWEISKLTGRDASRNSKISGEFETGYDVDIIAGYDWGLIRTEAEFGYKRANFQTVTGVSFGATGQADGYARALTATANVLLDFEIRPGFHLYGGPGIGYGWFRLHPKVLQFGGDSSKLDDENQSGLFGQLVAGASFAVTPRIDFGLKARHIQSQKLTYDSGFYGKLKGKFRADSLLVSLIYNFGSAAVAEPVLPPPPVVVEAPPPPPPPPATQSCADGTVILASDACPPPPPPPPVIEPERG